LAWSSSSGPSGWPRSLAPRGDGPGSDRPPCPVPPDPLTPVPPEWRYRVVVLARRRGAGPAPAPGRLSPRCVPRWPQHPGRGGRLRLVPGRQGGDAAGPAPCGRGDRAVDPGRGVAAVTVAARSTERPETSATSRPPVVALAPTAAVWPGVTPIGRPTASCGGCCGRSGSRRTVLRPSSPTRRGSRRVDRGSCRHSRTGVRTPPR